MGVCQEEVCFEQHPGVVEGGWRGGELSALVVQPSPTPSQRPLGILSKMAPGLSRRG